MEKLLMLNPVVSYEANAQASEICHLMEAASRENKQFITYNMPITKSLHPFVHHVLTSKGFVIKEEHSSILEVKTYCIGVE